MAALPLVLTPTWLDVAQLTPGLVKSITELLLVLICPYRRLTLVLGETCTVECASKTKPPPFCATDGLLPLPVAYRPFEAAGAQVMRVPALFSLPRR